MGKNVWTNHSTYFLYSETYSRHRIWRGLKSDAEWSRSFSTWFVTASYSRLLWCSLCAVDLVEQFMLREIIDRWGFWCWIMFNSGYQIRIALGLIAEPRRRASSPSSSPSIVEPKSGGSSPSSSPCLIAELVECLIDRLIYWINLLKRVIFLTKWLKRLNLLKD